MRLTWIVLILLAVACKKDEEAKPVCYGFRYSYIFSTNNPGDTTFAGFTWYADSTKCDIDAAKAAQLCEDFDTLIINISNGYEYSLNRTCNYWPIQ